MEYCGRDSFSGASTSLLWRSQGRMWTSSFSVSIRGDFASISAINCLLAALVRQQLKPFATIHAGAEGRIQGKDPCALKPQRREQSLWHNSQRHRFTILVKDYSSAWVGSRMLVASEFVVDVFLRPSFGNPQKKFRICRHSSVNTSSAMRQPVM